MVETMRSTRFWKKMELGEVARETTKKKEKKKKRKASTRVNQLTLFLSFLFFSFLFFFLTLFPSFHCSVENPSN